MRRRGALAAAAITVGAWMLSGSASAGDFYLRAGIVLDRPAGTTFTDRDCSSASPAALYGCGRGGDGAPYGSRGGFGTAPVLELGLGYAAAPAIRMEVLGEYRPRLAFEGRANFLEPGRRQSVAAELSSLSGMLAGYVDLPVTGAGEDRSFRAVRGGRGGRRAHADWRDADDVPEDASTQVRSRSRPSPRRWARWSTTRGPRSFPAAPGTAFSSTCRRICRG